MRQRVCANCEWFDPTSRQGETQKLRGLCRVRSVEAGTWPPRWEDEWCGEHVERDAPPQFPSRLLRQMTGREPIEEVR